MDIRVSNTVVFGLSENIENLVQESGRSMRGGDQETQGRMGLSFFFHKGSLGKHQVPISEVYFVLFTEVAKL